MVIACILKGCNIVVLIVYILRRSIRSVTNCSKVGFLHFHYKNNRILATSVLFCFRFSFKNNGHYWCTAVDVTDAMAE